MSLNTDIGYVDVPSVQPPGASLKSTATRLLLGAGNSEGLSIVETNIELDVYAHNQSHSTINAIALDSKTRYVAAALFDNNSIYDVDPSSTVTLTVARPDKARVQVVGSTYTYTTSIETTVNGAYAELTQVALAIKGSCRAQFKIVNGEQILRTEIFSINNGEALDDSDDWAGDLDGHNLDEMAESIETLETSVGTLQTDVSGVKEELNAISVPPIKFDGFINGQQIQTYQVGRTITFKADASNIRAINKTPIYFDRKIFLVPPTGYEAYICHVTAQDNLLVTDSTEAYVTNHWVTAQSHIIMQVRRTDRAALSADDMAVINAWIDFRGKTFLDEDFRRMVSTKKSYYDGTGTAFGNNHNNFTLAHITDVHSDVFRYANFRQFVDKNKDLIDVAICTGDLVDLQQDEQWDAVNGVEGVTEILQVVGNHDKGHQSGDTLLTDEELVSKFGITTNTGMMYYYRDFGDYRVIVLNQFEADVRSEYKYSEDELTWLLSTLDNSITANKHVIVACHIADTFPVSNNTGFYQRYNRWLNNYPPMQSGIEAVIDAFKRGTSVTATVSDISISHTFSASGDFLCWICGHYHGDYIGYSQTYSDQLYLMGNCGVCTSPFKGNMGETNSDLARISGTPTEDCFNIYSFDLANRLVKVARIGANVNDMMTERKMAVYSI